MDDFETMKEKVDGMHSGPEPTQEILASLRTLEACADPDLPAPAIAQIFYDLATLIVKMDAIDIYHEELNPSTILIATINASVYMGEFDGEHTIFASPDDGVGAHWDLLPSDSLYETSKLIWSFCACLHYCLTKEEPWGGDLEAKKSACKSNTKYKIKDTDDLEFPFSEAAHDKCGIFFPLLCKGLKYRYKDRIRLVDLVKEMVRLVVKAALDDGLIFDN
jgi:hypothetical protein